jgi:hypothetical protein
MATSKPIEVQARAVEDEAVEVMGDLRRAFADLLADLPPPVHRAVDLEQALGLDKKLAWQVFRVAQSVHPLGEVHNLPARSSVRRLLEAARKRRVSMRVIDRLETAFARFDQFAVVHAGSRDSLVSVLSGLGGRKDAQYEIKTRKSHFRTAAHFWGIHARMLVRTSIFHAKPGPAYIEDSVLIQATIGLERVRISQATDLTMMMRTKSDPPVAGATALSPIRHDAELLEEFCSGPKPEISPHPEGSTQGESKLRLPPGRTGAATLYSMQLHECLSNSLQTDYYGRTFLTIPTEALVWEMLMPVGWTDPTTVRASMYACREHPEQAFSERATDLMPQQETVEYLGTLDSAPILEGSPRHSQAVRHVIERLGWMDTRFDVYRCSVQYPMLHTMLSMRIDAAKR